MATVGSSILSTPSAGNAFPEITGEQIENVTVTVAETTHILPTGTKVYKIQNRGNKLVKLAFSMGTSGTTYWSLWPSTPAETFFIKSTSVITLYMSATGSSQVVEIWSGQ